MRPIFQYISLRGVSAADMAGWLQAALGTKVHISTSPQANAVLILGLPEDIQAANEIIGTLDQPRLAGHRSLRIEPVFWSAAQLSEKLIDILRAEGYFVGPSLQNPGAVIVLPLRPSNTLVVFASDQKTLTHVETWVRDLDHASQVDPQRSLFFYRVRNTTAESLAAVLNSVLQGKYAASTATAPFEERGLPPGQPPPPSSASRRPSGGCRWTSPGSPPVCANRDRPGA
jgi:general secretion pathway protein D